MKATVVADCGPVIGLGHLRRCLVLGEALRERGIECRFVVPDALALKFIRDAGFDGQSWPRDLALLPPTDLLVVDSYRVDVNMMCGWARRFTVRMVIDDLADRPIDADLVLNQNIFAPALDYREVSDCPVLAGPQYALIAPAFFSARHATSQKDRLSRILVVFGGTDDGSLGVPAAKSILTENPDSAVDLVISPLKPPTACVTRLAAEMHDRVTIHRGADMPSLMAKAGIYVGGAGSTVLEAAAAGLKIVAVETVENHRRNGAALRQLGETVQATPDAGETAKAVSHALNNYNPGSLSELLDGLGPKRAVEALLGHVTINRSIAVQPAHNAKPN